MHKYIYMYIIYIILMDPSHVKLWMCIYILTYTYVYICIYIRNIQGSKHLNRAIRVKKWRWKHTEVIFKETYKRDLHMWKPGYKHVYIYVHIYMYIYIYIFPDIYIHVHMYIHTYIHRCVYICIYIQSYIYTCIHMFTF